MRKVGRFRRTGEELRAALWSLREWLATPNESVRAEVDLRLLVRTFLLLGVTAFGGGMAVIVQIRRVVVGKHRWLTDEEFLDAVSLAQSLPGANAANAISYIGLKLSGVRGAVIALTAFILPSFVIMVGLTIAHTYLFEIPDARRVFQGFNAAVVGLIAATTVRLGKTAMQQHWHLELGVAVAFLLVFTQTTVVEVVLLSGMIGFIIRTWKSRLRHRVREQLKRDRKKEARSIRVGEETRRQTAEMIEKADRLTGEYQLDVRLTKRQEGARDSGAVSGDGGESGQRLNSYAPIVLVPALFWLMWPILNRLMTVWQLATIFLRVGTITFGGGLVMIPQIEMDVCEVHRWMDHRTFADGMAFGQITPGPVLITATFIGYKVAGVVGALVATLAAFLPSFLMTIVAGRSIDRFRTSFHVQAFLSGVAPAVVGMLAAAGVSLAKSGLGSPESYAVATLACLLMLRAKLNPVLIILLCGVIQLGISRGLVDWLGI